jgi:hypothetical protein
MPARSRTAAPCPRRAPTRGRSAWASLLAATLASTLGLGLGLGLAGPARADAPMSPEELARRALESTLLLADQARAEVELEVSKGGEVVRRRRLVAYVKRDGEQAKSYVEFLSPADVAGTRFLSSSTKDGDTQQFIFLPAYRKVKRVIGAQKAQSFVGTDFAFADLEGRAARDWLWTARADESVDGTPAHVVEGRLRTNGPGYQRIVVWVHAKAFVPLRTEMYGADPTVPEKRFRVVKLAPVEGKLVVREATMETVAAGSSTRLVVRTLDVTTPIPDDRFTKDALER